MTSVIVPYEAEVAQWREQAEATLRAEWISLAGLFELRPGNATIGTAQDNAIVLPADSAPPRLGALRVDEQHVTLTVAAGSDVRVNGAAVGGTTLLRSDADGAPDIVSVGSLTLFVIQRGARRLLRLRDANSPTLASFGGRRWFPVREEYLVSGTFVPYDPPKPLQITNILGDTSAQRSPGYVVFALGGQQHRLDVTKQSEQGLFLHFRDATSGVTTYGAGRGLQTAPLAGEEVILDFNRAISPPCAFTDYATCPLPPAQNHLSVAIAAGERLHDGEQAKEAGA